MPRLNLTLGNDTYADLERHAKSAAKPTARVAREILREGLARRREAERRRQLAADYAAGRADARTLRKEFESAQLDLTGDEEA